MTAVLAFLAGIWKFLRSVPWQLWVFIAIVAGAYWYGETKADAREAACNARWEAAQAEADRNAREDTARRDQAATGVNATTAGKATEVSAATRTETASAVDRVRHESRTIVVPAACPTGVPAGVRNEGRAAVERARAAGNKVRAGANH